MRKIVIFGTGQVVKRFIQILKNGICEIEAFCDNNASTDALFLAKPVIKPNKLNEYVFDHILIGSIKYYDEIKKQLIEQCKISEEKIMSIEILKFVDYRGKIDK